MASCLKYPVFVVLGDSEVRRLLVKTLSATGYEPTPFVNGSDFIQSLEFLPSGVAIVDLQLPDMTGLAVLEGVLSRRRDIPLIMTASATDLRTVVQVIKKGADDFVEQPFAREALFATIAHACALVPGRSEDHKRRVAAEKCVRSLTAREREILQAAQVEPDSKAIAARFHLSLRTVETYRTRIMKKCGVRRFADAISLCSLVQDNLPRP